VAKRHETPAVFDMFFRKPPFNGAFTVVAGLSQVLAFPNP
jgi:nicotinic acid phosphoribosyltransferase